MKQILQNKNKNKDETMKKRMECSILKPIVSKSKMNIHKFILTVPLSF